MWRHQIIRLFFVFAALLGHGTLRAATPTDSVQDSLQTNIEPAELFIMAPDPNRPNLLLDSLLQLITIKNGDFMHWVDYANSQQDDKAVGTPKYYRERWVLAMFGVLLLFFGIIKLTFPTEVTQIVQAFYNERVLAQVNKEDNLFSSWPFVFLYVLFGISCGLFLYLLSAHFVDRPTPGFLGFIWICILVLVLFSIKIFVTRMLGVVFQVRRMAREYISVLYLCYFNASLLFIPSILLLSLIASEQRHYLIWMMLGIIFLILTFRLTKTGITILGKHQFPKFYLITYLCTLEIIPILILMKVLV